MPLMHAPDGRQRIVPDRSIPGYQARGWNVAGQTDDPPAKSDVKAVWVDYASSRGIDTDGMTKDQIIAAAGS